MQSNIPTTMTKSMFHGSDRVFAPLLLALGAISPISTFAQDAVEGGAEEGAHTETFVDLFLEGGWVMWPLLICSVVLVWLTVDLWLRTGVAKVAPRAHVSQVQDLFRAGDYVGAYQFCKGNLSPFCDVTRVTLSFVGDGEEAVDTAMFAELNKVNSTIQTRINYLSVLGVCTPMIGLIGTVSGMKGAFASLGKSGAQDVGALSGHIGEVLVATATGLIVAVPAFLFFYFLRNRLQGGLTALQDVTTALFRKMPYEHLKGAHVGEEEFFAAIPNWVEGGAEVATPVVSAA
jgi:biopolymer transport protein ExbB